MSASRGADVDVLVVGAGPAGLSAAVAAAEAGKRVLVLDQGLRPGGQIWRHRAVESLPPIAQSLIERAKRSGATIATGTRVVDVISPRELVVDFRGRIDRQRTAALVLATGAKELLLPFPGWTLPGVVGIGGLQALIKSGLDLAGARVVIAGTGPLLFPVAATAAAAGADVVIVAEQASRGALMRFGAGLVSKPGAITQAVRYRVGFLRTPFRTSSWVAAAEGFGRVQRASVSVRGVMRAINCDWLAVGMGLVPNTELAQITGCQVSASAVQVDATQATSISGVWAAGECTGVKGDAPARIEGTIAGLAAAGLDRAAHGLSLQRGRDAGRRFASRLAATFSPRHEVLDLATSETIVCRCEDVVRGDIDPAWTQRQAKLWTRVGMGECQGAVCGAACGALFGWHHNVARPPLSTPLLGDWGDALADEGTD
jgi:NADPH-dependent 2,4-dienoyl-CoA reductase/sulfur reductase-like enzyme